MYKKATKILLSIFCFLILAVFIFYISKNQSTKEVADSINEQISPSTQQADKVLYKVIKVVDGDTIDLEINGKIERIRLIGIDTPEVVDPRKPVECFAIEASNKAKSVLTGEDVAFEMDKTQGERDKYGRLLGYVFLPSGENFNLIMIRDGFAYKYTYNLPYKYQTEFKLAQKEAEENKRGLWADGVCADKILVDNNQRDGCIIKGNISAKNEKIYHLPSCEYYSKTVISESSGEKWFCTEDEALQAGWRKALNC